MKYLFAFIFLLGSFISLSDIAPNPIEAKSIITSESCEIQMVEEQVFIDVYPDSSLVSCTFSMKNHGDSITLSVGFPVMNFIYHSIGYGAADREQFEIWVDGTLLNEKDIQVPAEMQEVYKNYMEAYATDRKFTIKKDSIDRYYGVIEKKNRIKVTKGTLRNYEKVLDNLYEWRRTMPGIDMDLLSGFLEVIKNNENYPWYIWQVSFAANESRTIKVIYRLPNGIESNHRYVKYLLSTGAGWQGNIEKAAIKIKLHRLKMRNVNEIKPSGYMIDKALQEISWQMKDLEPTIADDILVKF
jgi:hypothetical protein